MGNPEDRVCRNEAHILSRNLKYRDISEPCTKTNWVVQASNEKCSFGILPA